jgi:hypothetical protein
MSQLASTTSPAAATGRQASLKAFAQANRQARTRVFQTAASFKV